MFLGLTEEQKKIFEYEVISEDTRLKISRLFRNITRREDNDSDIEIIYKNRIINIARQVEGLSLYRLESDVDGYYLPAEKAWHFGELEIISKRQTSIQLIETICDLINEGLIDENDINNIFQYDNSQIKFKKINRDISLEIDKIDNPLDDIILSEHPNIRKLIERMDILFNNKDYAGVLHASASIFETLAKDVIRKNSIENQPLGSFFELYRKQSKLPNNILELIKEIYDKRNKEPLAGHGSTKETMLSHEDAIILIEMTKSFVKMERKLSTPEKIEIK